MLCRRPRLQRLGTSRARLIFGLLHLRAAGTSAKSKAPPSAPSASHDWMTAPLPGPDGPSASSPAASSLVIFATRRAESAWQLIEYLFPARVADRFRTLTVDLPPRPVRSWKPARWRRSLRTVLPAAAVTRRPRPRFRNGSHIEDEVTGGRAVRDRADDCEHARARTGPARRRDLEKRRWISRARGARGLAAPAAGALAAGSAGDRALLHGSGGASFVLTLRISTSTRVGGGAGGGDRPLALVWLAQLRSTVEASAVLDCTRNTLYFRLGRRSIVDTWSRSPPRCARFGARAFQQCFARLVRASGHDRGRGRSGLAQSVSRALRLDQSCAGRRGHRADRFGLGDPHWSCRPHFYFAAVEELSQQHDHFCRGAARQSRASVMKRPASRRQRRRSSCRRVTLALLGPTLLMVAS